MDAILTRRGALLSGLAAAACAAAPASPSSNYTPPPNDPRFSAIEARVGGRVGVAAWNTGTDAWLAHRPHERFAMCSTFKWLLAAQMLHMDMHMPGFREQRVLFGEVHLVPWSPVTSARILDGPIGRMGEMTVEELCAAAVTVSDNTAANLLLQGVFGPEGFTRFLRETGDGVSRLDRVEPHLNENAPGDERDTTTPDAMARNLRRFLLGHVEMGDPPLSEGARERLIGWMVESRTGLDRLRAGLPADWRVADKTGTGMNGAVNDVAVVWPPERAPIVIAVYLSESGADQATLNAAHAEIARIVAGSWA